MYNKRNLRKAAELGIALTAITSLVLAGCGGGSGASGGAATTSATITPFKGPFSSGATITIRDANGNLVSLLSGGTINASGVANVTYSTGVAYPLIVEVAGSYYNENTGAVETASAPLRGIISGAGATANVPVTIVTEAAVADLQNRLGGFAPAHPVLAASAVAALNAAGTMLGIPASAVPAFDPVSRRTSDPDTLRLAAWAVAANGLTGATLVDRVRALAQGFAAMNPASAPVDVISQAAYDSALSAVTSGASSVMAAGASAPTPPAIPTASFAALYAGAVATAASAASAASSSAVTTATAGSLATLGIWDVTVTGSITGDTGTQPVNQTTPGVAGTPTLPDAATLQAAMDNAFGPGVTAAITRSVNTATQQVFVITGSRTTGPNPGSGTLTFTFNVAAATGSGSATGSGLYTAVTTQASSGFLSLLNTACTTRTAVSGGTDYSNCTQPAMASYATNLVANMWMGGLPHQTGGSIVGGPSSYSPGTAKVSFNQGMAGVAVNDSCTVSIAEPYIPIVQAEVRGARYYATGVNFNFNGTANDTISVTSGGVVSQYTMTNGQGGKIEVHPNLALSGGGQSGTEAVVGSVDNSGVWANFFICK